MSKKEMVNAFESKLENSELDMVIEIWNNIFPNEESLIETNYLKLSETQKGEFAQLLKQILLRELNKTKIDTLKEKYKMIFEI